MALRLGVSFIVLEQQRDEEEGVGKAGVHRRGVPCR
jgi:hypothetical protein